MYMTYMTRTCLTRTRMRVTWGCVFYVTLTLTLALGAHHLDLMFSTEDDPQSVRDVRAVELSYLSKWEAASTPPAPGRRVAGRERG